MHTTAMFCDSCKAENDVDSTQNVFTCNKCGTVNSASNAVLTPNYDRTIQYLVREVEVSTHPLPLGATLSAARSVDETDSIDKDREKPDISQGADHTISSRPKVFSVDVNGAFILKAPSQMIDPIFVTLVLRSDQVLIIQPSVAEPKLDATVQEGDHIFNVS